jgi:hypothetical protein
MSESTSFTIGSEVACSDGPCGELRFVVVDPLARALTHLVVEPPHRVGAGRLVPIELVSDASEDQIQLSCTRDEFDALAQAEDTQFLPGMSGDYGYGAGQFFTLPYFGLSGMGMGMGGLGSLGMGGMVEIGGAGGVPQPLVTERVPLGEVAVRRGDPVAATDGEIGRVQGLVIDPSDHHVTHFLLDEGHLWGHKRVAIPISAVAEVGAEGVRVSLSKDEVRDLPPVEVTEPH